MAIKTLNHRNMISISSGKETLSAQQSVAVAKCAELAALADQHTDGRGEGYPTAIDATQAAYRVGYESTSQFSREYSRMFGAPPIRDIERLRVS
jgi:AraC-like DNA-binding protein